MFAFIGRLFRSKNDPNIFRYWDGTKHRSADPLEIERVFVRLMGESWRKQVAKLATPAVPFGAVGTEAKKLRDEREELNQKILAAINEAFDVVPYKDDAGLTIVQRRGLLEAYLRFCNDLIEIARPFVMRQSRASPSPGNPPTSNGAVSSSVASG